MPYYRMPDQEQLYVREFGQGKPVLVLSGLGMQSWQWMPFLIQNSNQFKFIIPDWRGFGRSNPNKTFRSSTSLVLSLNPTHVYPSRTPTSPPVFVRL